MTLDTNSLAHELYQREIIKFGNFTLHSGKQSSVYFDLRSLIIYPKFLNQIIDLYVEALVGLENTFDYIAGPAYTGIPLATLLSQRLDKPMILVRKETKTHGTMSNQHVTGIENSRTSGQVVGPMQGSAVSDANLGRVLIVDDVITSGDSILEVTEILENCDYHPVEVLVLIDRRPIFLRKNFLIDDLRITTVTTAEAILKPLINRSEIIDNFPESVKQILANSDWFPSLNQRLIEMNNWEPTKWVEHSKVKRLLNIMVQKQSRLVLSADLSDPGQLLETVERLGPEIAVLKIHSDILYLVGFVDFFDNLKRLSQLYNFLILEDRKLADIGSTTVSQLKRMASWADLVTAHIISGPGVIQAVRETCPDLGVLLIAEMSSADNMITPEYTKIVVRMAQENPEVVVGLICQSALLDARFLHFTPGINLGVEGDNLGQIYRRPNEVDTDLFIVGRGILKADDQLAKAKEYRSLSWRK